MDKPEIVYRKVEPNIWRCLKCNEINRLELTHCRACHSPKTDESPLEVLGESTVGERPGV